MQMKFFPSLWAERGPVAETDLGTVGNGRGGANFFNLCVVLTRFVAGPGASSARRFKLFVVEVAIVRVMTHVTLIFCHSLGAAFVLIPRPLGRFVSLKL